MTTVLLVDDHPLFLDGVRAALDRSCRTSRSSARRTTAGRPWRRRWPCAPTSS